MKPDHTSFPSAANTKAELVFPAVIDKKHKFKSIIFSYSDNPPAETEIIITEIAGSNTNTTFKQFVLFGGMGQIFFGDDETDEYISAPNTKLTITVPAVTGIKCRLQITGYRCE